MNNKIRDSVSYRVFRVCNTIFMCLVIAATLYPMLYVVFASFSEPDLFLTSKGLLLKPLGFSLASYKMVFKDPMIIRGFGNTLFVVAAGLAVNMLFTIVGAYVLSRKNAKLVRPANLMILFTMYFSGGMIPLYFVVKTLGLTNSLFSLIFPTAINTYNLIIMRSAFVSIPGAIEDSARVDGANHLVMLFRILVPLIVPTIMVIVLYYAVQHWNAWFNASIYLNDRTKFPLQLILREVLVSNDMSKMTSGVGAADSIGVAETVKYAVMVVSTVPILCLYPFLQRYFVKGVMIGAVKG